MADDVKVLILLGSESDRERITKLPRALEHFGITYKEIISSAHRNPE